MGSPLAQTLLSIYLMQEEVKGDGGGFIVKFISAARQTERQTLARN